MSLCSRHAGVTTSWVPPAFRPQPHQTRTPEEKPSENNASGPRHRKIREYSSITLRRAIQVAQEQGENARLLTVPQQHHVVLDPHTPHAAPHAPQQCEHQHDALSRPALSHTQPHTPRHANIDTRHITETSNQSLEELTAKFLALEEQYNTNILRQTKRLIVFPTSMQSPIFPTPLPPPQQDGNTPQLRGAKSQFDKSAVDVSESSPRPQSRGARPHFEGMPFHYSSRHGMTRDTSRQLDRDTSVYSNACYNPIGILDSPYEKRVVHAGSLGALFAADNPVKDVGTAQTQRVEGEQRGGWKEGIESQAAAAVDATAGGIVAVDNNENDKGASRRVYSQFAANGRGNFRGCDNANLREQLLAHGRKIMIDNHTLKTHSCYQDSQILDLNLTLEDGAARLKAAHTNCTNLEESIQSRDLLLLQTRQDLQQSVNYIHELQTMLAIETRLQKAERAIIRDEQGLVQAHGKGC